MSHVLQVTLTPPGWTTATSSQFRTRWTRSATMTARTTMMSTHARPSATKSPAPADRESTALSTVAHGDRPGQSSPELESGESATWTRAPATALVDICSDATTLWKLAPESLWTETYALTRTVPPSMPRVSDGVARISNSGIPMKTKLGHLFSSQLPLLSPLLTSPELNDLPTL